MTFVFMLYRKLRKLFTKLQTVKQDIVDVTEEYNRDRRDLEMTQVTKWIRFYIYE